MAFSLYLLNAALKSVMVFYEIWLSPLNAAFKFPLKVLRRYGIVLRWKKQYRRPMKRGRGDKLLGKNKIGPLRIRFSHSSFKFMKDVLTDLDFHFTAVAFYVLWAILFLLVFPLASIWCMATYRATTRGRGTCETIIVMRNARAYFCI